ncbi:copper-binding protein [Virgibacillus phasianinus]|uniref:Copper chaperone CopZ n=1 Tax=Virgibacillus phasianinus TaxID=2017483 RepID=A0A220U3E0_9BACI|nr:copper chaperone CopZ [Virgibacillus phasianinus]ASK62804.1 copper-binding protein [Virgibacillus phasianinus]
MQTTIDVRGMTCGHCEQAVKGALTALNGVEGVEVHLTAGKVDVTYDDAKVTIAAMRAAIEEQGYDVVA